MRLQSKSFPAKLVLGITASLWPLVTLANLTETPGVTVPGAGAAILPIIANTALIVAVVLGLGWVVKRAGLPSGGRRGGIEILASQSIGAKEKILVIQVGEKQLVVGSTPGNIRTLYTADEPLIQAGSPTIASPFSARLSAILQSKAS